MHTAPPYEFPFTSPDEVWSCDRDALKLTADYYDLLAADGWELNSNQDLAPYWLIDTKPGPSREIRRRRR